MSAKHTQHSQRRIWNLTIRAKLACLFISLVAVISLSIYMYFPAKLEEQAFAAIKGKAESIALMTAFSITPSLYFDDPLTMKGVLESAQQNKELVYAIVTDTTGRIMVAIEQARAERANFTRQSVDEATCLARKLYQTSRPVIKDGNKIGRLYLGFSLNELIREIGSSRARVALVSVVIFLIGMVAVFGISAVIARPIGEMAVTASAITQGDLTRRAKVYSRDEVGILAEAFNNMLDHLEVAQGELQSANQTLEKRTIDLKQEISVRKHAEVALRRSERKSRVLFHSTPDPIFIYDKETRHFLDCNKAVLRIYKYSKNELESMTPFDLHPPEDLVKVEANIDVKNIDKPATYIHLTKDGRQIDVEIISDEINYEGRPAWISIVRDITERKRAELILKNFAAKLEQSNRELQDFAYVASHDLQEPLRKIQAFGDRLRAKCGDVLNEQGLDYLGRMQNAAGRMQDLINGLLTYSRVTTKAEPLSKVDLSGVTGEVLSDLEVRIEETGAKIQFSNLPTIEAAPLQMRQLLQNLIGNALKFNRPETPPVVTISSEITNGAANGGNGTFGGKFCQITVADNGIGFDEKYADRIFGVFQRLHGRNEYQGTGVGLAVCRKIVERHGGTIIARSEPEAGASFIVSLPLEQPNGATANGDTWKTDHDISG